MQWLILNQHLTTHITISDKFGNVLVWQKAGSSGFKVSRRVQHMPLH